MEENWDGVEKSLRQLLGFVKKDLSASEQREVADYIKESEFEAALEAIVDALVEKKAPVSKQALDAARKLASTMDLSGELTRINKQLAKPAK